MKCLGENIENYWRFFVVLDKTETKINKKTREEAKKVTKYDLMVWFLLRPLLNLIDDVSEKVHNS